MISQELKELSNIMKKWKVGDVKEDFNLFKSEMVGMLQGFTIVIETMSERMSSIDTKLNSIDRKIDETNREISSVKSELTARMDAVKSDLTIRIDETNKRIDENNREINSLRMDMVDKFEKSYEKIDAVKSELVTYSNISQVELKTMIKENTHRLNNIDIKLIKIIPTEDRLGDVIKRVDKIDDYIYQTTSKINSQSVTS